MICLQTKNLCLSPVYRQVDKFLSIDKRRLVVAIVSIATSKSKIFVFNRSRLAYISFSDLS
jgi:hypothetical protein